MRRSIDEFVPFSYAFHGQDPLFLTGQQGFAISVALPFGEESAPANGVGEGIIAYDNGNGSSTVPVPQADGSVAVHTVIASAGAPCDGSASILNGDGKLVAGVTRPWATDASGRAVPTRYEADGLKITRVVEHTSAGVQYQVVADPWFGVDLIESHPWITSTSRGYVVNLNPTFWGRQFNAYETHIAHVDELRTKLAQIGWGLAGTIQEQYLCHVVGNLFEWGTYNMESWRPWVYWGHQLNPWTRCNP